VTESAAERTVRVPAERLPGWIQRFAERHGAPAWDGNADCVFLTAPDGARATVTGTYVCWAAGDAVEAVVERVQRSRTVGAILVRRGGYAIGVFHGAQLLASKVDSTYVQGRTKAGGWSQQRYARRRANQAHHAYAEAADVAARVLLPRANELEVVVGGGDRVGVEAVLADPRLTELRSRWTGDVLPTVDPRLRVLEAFAEQFRSVTITLNSLA
jgi:hypothetical protein